MGTYSDTILQSARLSSDGGMSLEAEGRVWTGTDEREMMRDVGVVMVGSHSMPSPLKRIRVGRGGDDKVGIRNMIDDWRDSQTPPILLGSHT